MQAGDVTRIARTRTSHHMSKQLVLVSGFLLKNVNGTVVCAARDVDALIVRTVCQIVGAFADCQSLNLFSRLRIEDGDFPISAADEQAMIRGIHSSRNVLFEEFDEPTN